MFQRLLIIGIIGFWLVMTGALVHLWINPVNHDLLSIPVDHVARQMFHHEQASNLSIMRGNRRVGSLMLQPRRFDDQGVGVVDFSGSLMLELPFMSEQPFSWRGTAELDREFRLKFLRIRIDAHGPKIGTDIELYPEERKVVYRIGNHGEDPYESTLPLSPAGAREALESFGIDPIILSQIPLGGIGAAATEKSRESDLQITARRSEIDIQGERAQTFSITIRRSELNLMEVDISNLGQILSLKTAFGFGLQPEH